MTSSFFKPIEASTTFLPDHDPDPLLLTVRFSASLPDLPLDVPHPETTTAAGLKQLIRSRLPTDLSAHRLRLIYAGRGLEDATPLTVSLKLPPPPPPAQLVTLPDSDEYEIGNEEDKGKGKAPVRNQHPPRPRIYIHCSIGDVVLSESELEREALSASTVQKDLSRGDGTTNGIDGDNESSAAAAAAAATMTTTLPAPRGFDRLLSAGFTAAEVAALRSQFLALHAVSRTPDTMPTGSELRELEDRWMDEGSSGMGVAGMAGGSGGTGTTVAAAGEGGGISFGDDDGGFGGSSRGAIDDMLWGAVMGFFWPVGCAMWLRREEGVWSWRKGLAVFIGVLFNAACGTMRIVN